MASATPQITNEILKAPKRPAMPPHKKYARIEKRLLAMHEDELRYHKEYDSWYKEYSPYSEEVYSKIVDDFEEKWWKEHSGKNARDKKQWQWDAQKKVIDDWLRHHPEGVIAVNSKDMMPKLEGAGKTTEKQQPQMFVHTTRLAAWRATRFKGRDSQKQAARGDGIPLQGMTYADFIKNLATVRNKGDREAAESKHGGLLRVGGMPLVIPIQKKVFKKQWRPPIWKPRAQPPKCEEKPKKSVKMDVPANKAESKHKKLRKTSRSRSRSHSSQRGSVSKEAGPDNVESFTSLSSVCSWCSLAAKRPPPPSWIDPNILKAPRTKNLLWKRTFEREIQTDPLTPFRSGSAQREDAWRFLQGAEPSETSVFGSPADLSRQPSESYDPALSGFLRDTIADSLADAEIVGYEDPCTCRQPPHRVPPLDSAQGVRKGNIKLPPISQPKLSKTGVRSMGR